MKIVGIVSIVFFCMQFLMTVSIYAQTREPVATPSATVTVTSSPSASPISTIPVVTPTASPQPTSVVDNSPTPTTKPVPPAIIQPITPTPQQKAPVLTVKKPTIPSLPKVITAPFDFAQSFLPRSYYNEQGLQPHVIRILLLTAFINIVSGVMLIQWPVLRTMKIRMPQFHLGSVRRRVAV